MPPTSSQSTRNSSRERSGVSPMRSRLYSRNSVQSHNSRLGPSWVNSWNRCPHNRSNSRGGYPRSSLCSREPLYRGRTVPRVTSRNDNDLPLISSEQWRSLSAGVQRSPFESYSRLLAPCAASGPGSEILQIVFRSSASSCSSRVAISSCSSASSLRPMRANVRPR